MLAVQMPLLRARRFSEELEVDDHRAMANGEKYSRVLGGVVVQVRFQNYVDRS